MHLVDVLDDAHFLEPFHDRGKQRAIRFHIAVQGVVLRRFAIEIQRHLLLFLQHFLGSLLGEFRRFIFRPQRVRGIERRRIQRGAHLLQFAFRLRVRGIFLAVALAQHGKCRLLCPDDPLRIEDRLRIRDAPDGEHLRGIAADFLDLRDIGFQRERVVLRLRHAQV